MKILVAISIILCKLTRFILRRLGRGATALPGKLALRLCPQLLRHLASGVKTIVITGTNGKTTSSRIIEKMLSDAGLSFFSNRSGANLITGITTEFAVNAAITGRPKKEWALIECDEAASKKVFEYLNPAVVLVTNVFRDQLDRFGEVTQTLENIKIGVAAARNAVVCLNADCSLTSSIAQEIENRIIFYGIDTDTGGSAAPEFSDAMYCIRCKAEYRYDYVTFAHLGAFHCTNCGYRRPKADVAVTAVLEKTPDHTRVSLRAFGEDINVTVNLPAAYNIYNAAGAIAAGLALGLPLGSAADAVSTFKCGFGRMEKFALGGSPARMILVKNPVGCNQVLDYLAGISEKSLFVICLSDRIADGTDISWIWDADFERLADLGERLAGILVSGTRAGEMAMRLKYAGLPPGTVTVIEDYRELLAAVAAQDCPAYIMPTYTAMLELRDKISSAYGYGDFWE